MKIATSYFYQIRNFKRNMIPISTAIGDPKWYHLPEDKESWYFDKRGIINGLRCNSIIEASKKYCNGMCGPAKCTTSPDECCFLTSYRQALETIDLNKLMQNLEFFAQYYKKFFNIQDEIIIVFIVHEAWYNPCSERQPLINFFNSHNIECKELAYPIKGD